MDFVDLEDEEEEKEDEIEEEDEEKKEDEMPVSLYTSTKKQKKQEIQDIPPGFEKIKSVSQNLQPTAGTSPLRSSIQEESEAASPSELSDARKKVVTFLNTSLSSLDDMGSFERFKSALEVVINAGGVSSNEFPVQRLRELEADFRVAQREISAVDDGLALLPNAASKMEASDKQYSQIEDRVNKLKSRLDELAAESVVVRTRHDQALAELNLEQDVRAVIQLRLDRATELKEKKNKLAEEMRRISEQYETTKDLLKDQLGLDKVPANICKRVTMSNSGTAKQRDHS